MLEQIKQIAGNVSKTEVPSTFVFGTVISRAPLSVKIDDRFIIGESALILMKQFSNGFKSGDKLVLLREHGGQRYLVLGVIE